MSTIYRSYARPSFAEVRTVGEDKTKISGEIVDDSSGLKSEYFSVDSTAM